MLKNDCKLITLFIFQYIMLILYKKKVTENELFCWLFFNNFFNIILLQLRQELNTKQGFKIQTNKFRYILLGYNLTY